MPFPIAQAAWLQEHIGTHGSNDFVPPSDPPLVAPSGSAYPVNNDDNTPIEMVFAQIRSKVEQDEAARKKREGQVKAEMKEKDEMMGWKEGQRVHLFDMPNEVSHKRGEMSGVSEVKADLASWGVC